MEGGGLSGKKGGLFCTKKNCEGFRKNQTRRRPQEEHNRKKRKLRKKPPSRTFLPKEGKQMRKGEKKRFLFQEKGQL